MRKKLVAFLLSLTITFSIGTPVDVKAEVSKGGTTYTLEKEADLSANRKQPYAVDIGQVLSLKAAVKKDATNATATEKKTEVKPANTNQKHGSIAFSEITYKRPDFKKIQKDINAVDAMIGKKYQSKKIKALMDTIDEELTMAKTMGTYLYIQYFKNVTDTELFEEYTYVTKQVNLKLSAYSALCVKLLDSRYKSLLTKELSKEEINSIYEVYKTLNDEYTQIQNEISDLNSKYLTTMNASTIDVKGKKMSLEEILSSTELTAEEINTYYSDLMTQINDKSGKIYLNLVKKYKELAKMNGFDNVTDFYYTSYDRDYKKEDIAQFSQYVKQEIVPLYYDLYNSFTPEEITVLQSIPSNFNEMEPAFKTYFASVSPDMLKAYNYMKKLSLYDLEASPYKQQLNYTVYLSGFQYPYLSLTPSGTYRDVSNFIHEFGHFYSYYKHGDNLATNLDIMEMHSQMNEVLFSPYYAAYGDAYEPIIKNQLLTILSTIISGTLEDEFQQYVYSHDIKTVAELNRIYFQLKCEYGLMDANSGYTQDLSWMLIPHTFQSPLYYISYAISAFPALEVYTKSLTDRDTAIQMYDRIIYYGTEYGYTNLLVRCRMHTPFSQENVSKITDTLRNTLGLTKEPVIAPAA